VRRLCFVRLQLVPRYRGVKASHFPSRAPPGRLAPCFGAGIGAALVAKSSCGPDLCLRALLRALLQAHLRALPRALTRTPPQGLTLAGVRAVLKEFHDAIGDEGGAEEGARARARILRLLSAPGWQAPAEEAPTKAAAPPPPPEEPAANGAAEDAADASGAALPPFLLFAAKQSVLLLCCEQSQAGYRMQCRCPRADYCRHGRCIWERRRPACPLIATQMAAALCHVSEPLE